MTFFELIQRRQSTRKYSDRAVENEKISRCIEAARLAPSASNSQPWTFIVIDEPKLKNAVAYETYSTLVPFNKFAPQAAVIIAIVAEKPGLITQIGGKLKNKDFYLMDIGIAAEHICLQAAEDGLGSCMLGWFNEKKVMELLNVSKSKRIPLLITIGYPENEDQKTKKRRATEDILKYNRYE